MYREWLIEMLEGTERGTKSRLAEHVGWSGDRVSKILSGVRDINADELPKIAEFFGAMPPGFEAVSSPASKPIRSQEEILATLNRIEGISQRGVELALLAITASMGAKAPTQEQPSAGDQSAPATPRHESQSSR
jgi:hypothetical protein